MSRKPVWPPTIHQRHDCDSCFVIIDGKRRSLGKAGSEEAKQAYARLILEAETHGGKILPRDTVGVSVMELVEGFMAHAAGYYQDQRQLSRIKKAMDLLASLYGRTDAALFGGPELRTLVAGWCKEGHCRTYINALTGVVRKCFGWGVTERLVSDATAAVLYRCPNLRKHHSPAPEPEEIPPADLEAVERTLPHLLAPIRAMVRLQLLTGMRPGEVVLMRPCDIDRTWLKVDGVQLWLFSLEIHKTAWRGAPRHIPIGPAAQEVLRPYLERAPEMYCFSPAEGVAEHYRQRGRVWNPDGKRAAGERYSTGSYDRAVARVCARCNIVPSWSPNQLRHRAGTDTETQHGREKAQALLGHSNPTTTAIYAELLEKAARIAASHG
jgi:integrase